MPDFAIKVGTFWLASGTGIVSANKRWSETNVRGSGQQGNVSIGSTVINHNEIWVKLQGGGEIYADILTGCGSIREGHKVSLVWGAFRDGVNNGPAIYLYNHDLGADHFILNDKIVLLEKMRIPREPTLNLVLIKFSDYSNTTKDFVVNAVKSVMKTERERC